MIELLLIGMPIIMGVLYLGVIKNDRKIAKSKKKIAELERKLAEL